MMSWTWLRRSERVTPPTTASAARSASVDDGPIFDEELLARLRRVVLMSKRSIAEGLAGEHKSRRRGSSPEFSDFKSYSQGDDFRRIDWNIYSRLDDVFVRLSEVTTELTVHILIDASKSMDWKGRETVPTKFTYARRVAGSLAYVSLWHFDRVMITPFGSELATPFGPSQGRAHILPMLKFLTDMPAQGATNLPEAIERYVRARRRPGILIVVSDLLSGEPEQLQDQLHLLRTRGWQTIVVHVIDDAELHPAALTVIGSNGRPLTVELVELENGERLRLTPTPELIDRYGQAVTDWQTAIETACADEVADYVRLQTDWPFDSIVLKLMHEQGLVA